MPWIKVIDESEASGELKELYGSIKKARGKIANIIKIHSLLPKTMKTHIDLYLSVMFNRSKITREERELIAVVVSLTNKCDYCVNHHAEALNHYWKDETRLQKLISQGYVSVVQDERQLQMVKYAEKLTKAPNSVTEEDITQLHEVGLDDEQILHVNLIVSYFNFVNRIALGLGVTFSPEEVSGYKY